MQNPFSILPQAHSHTTSELYNVKSLSSSINSFGISLLMTMNPQSNFLISPFCIVQALMMCANGADGKTLQELLKAVHLDKYESMEQINSLFMQTNDFLRGDEQTILEIASSTWIVPDHQLKENYAKTVEQFYKAEAKTISSVHEINDWCSKATHGKISEIISQLSPQMKLILMNAIYFKGAFSLPFDEKLTASDKFYTKSKAEVPVQMMKLTESLPYFETDKFQAVQLPYKSSSSKVSFITTVVLPKENQSVEGIFHDFANDQSTLFHGFHKRKGKLEMPRFRVEFSSTLTDPLQKMGVREAFEKGFSQLSDPGDLVLSQIIHKTFLEVNEKGAEAAAVTAVIMKMAAMAPIPPFHMRVDRPFIFMIQEQHTNLLLFMGIIEHPKSS